MLPADVRQKLEQKLISNGFSDYVALTEWLAGEGYAISKSALQRFGSTFEDKCTALSIATQQAEAIVKASPDDEGAMNQALIRLIQKPLFDVLMQIEVDPKKVDINKISKSIADLARASISQQKHASLVRKEAREELLREQQAELSKMESEGFDKDTLSAVGSRISVYLPDNGRG